MGVNSDSLHHYSLLGNILYRIVAGESNHRIQRSQNKKTYPPLTLPNASD